jgi:hypothetical protein
MIQGPPLPHARHWPKTSEVARKGTRETGVESKSVLNQIRRYKEYRTSELVLETRCLGKWRSTAVRCARALGSESRISGPRDASTLLRTLSELRTHLVSSYVLSRLHRFLPLRLSTPSSSKIVANRMPSARPARRSPRQHASLRADSHLRLASPTASRYLGSVRELLADIWKDSYCIQYRWIFVCVLTLFALDFILHC